MNPVVKSKWVSALRSGDYQQTAGYLRCGNKFCCLGVLTDLYLEEKHEQWGLIPELDFDPLLEEKPYQYQGNSAALPDVVQEWAGLEDESGSFNGGIERVCAPGTENEHVHYHPTLIDLNDDLEWDFNKIADLIDEKF